MQAAFKRQSATSMTSNEAETASAAVDWSSVKPEDKTLVHQASHAEQLYTVCMTALYVLRLELLRHNCTSIVPVLYKHAASGYTQKSQSIEPTIMTRTSKGGLRHWKVFWKYGGVVVSCPPACDSTFMHFVLRLGKGASTNK